MTRQNVMLLLAFLMLGFIVAMLCYRFGDQKDVIVTFLTSAGGTVLGFIGAVYNYEFGSSRGSADKNALMGQMAVAQTNSPRGTP